MNTDVHLKADLRVRYGQATTAGAKSENEDCLGIRIPDDEALTTKGIALVIADGVSAADAGKEASEVCVQGFLADYYGTPDTWQVKTAAHRVLTALNRWLYGEGQRFADERKGFISAMSAMVLKSHTVHIFHVGDTRVYRLRDADFEQLTHDHTAVGTGKARYLARAMGLDLSLDVDYFHEDVEEGDVFFLSTDGIHEHLRSYEILSAIKDTGDDFDTTCEKIVKLALQNGSPDNLSCQLLRIEKLPTGSRKEFCDELGKLPFPPYLKPGLTLDGYEVMEVLDVSPRSQLYLVRDSKTREAMVMKTPSPNYIDDPAYIERFLIEEWIGRRISDSHLVRVLEKSRHPNFLYYLMERVQGQPLGEWIRANQKPDINRVVAIVDQIIHGLRAMHRRETLHQDLKPDNIVIEPDGNVKIIDFGSTFIAGVNEIRIPIERGVKLGTLRYSAPEYKLGHRPSQKSDLFSLGLIAYEMLTAGRHAYGEKFENADTLRDFSTLDYSPATRHNPLVPPWLDAALRTAVAINPENRYDALSEFVTDLQRPNTEFLTPAELPLMKRNPVRFWQILSALLVVAWMLTLLLK